LFIKIQQNFLFIFPGKGNYWTIHPNCLADFRKGDYRRRQARRRARRNLKTADTAPASASVPPEGYVQMTSTYAAYPRVPGVTYGALPVQQPHAGVPVYPQAHANYYAMTSHLNNANVNNYMPAFYTGYENHPQRFQPMKLPLTTQTSDKSRRHSKNDDFPSASSYTEYTYSL